MNIPFLPAAVCFTGFLFWSLLLTLKFYFFGYYDWDLALYDQVMWRLCHGSMFTSLIGTNFLADHAHFIAFLIAPIYFLFPNPLTLIYLKVFSFFAGAFILYKIARERLDERPALVVMGLYILHPANIFMLLYEFHFESLGIGLIFLLFYFFLKERWRAFMITAVVLMLVKENMPLIVVMFGLWGMVAKKGRRLQWGLAPFLMGLVFFALTMFIIIPLVRENLPSSGSIYWTLYTQVGNSPGNILQNLFLHPFKIAHLIINKGNFIYLYALLGGFFFFALRSPQILFLAAPIFLQNLLSNNPAQHSILFHYAATIVPFAAVACVTTLSVLRNNPLGLRRVFWIFSVVAYLHTAFLAWPDLQIRLTRLFDPLTVVREEMVESVPEGQGVVASFVFLSHLTHHKNLYAFYNVWKDVDYFTGETPFKLPSSVKYALIDFNDPWLQVDLWDNYALTRRHIEEFLRLGWIVQKRFDGIVLLKRKG